MDADSSKAWQEIGCETLSNGFLHLVRWHGRFQRYSGDWSAPVHREIVFRGDAVAVLPIDLAQDTLLLVKQFRIAAAQQPGGPWQDEILAGLAKPGEVLEDVARREAREETGLVLDTLVPMLSYQPSPGGSDETLHLYLAPTRLDQAGGVHGLESENEDILSTVEPVEDVLARVSAGDIRNSMTLIALQWLALQRTQGQWVRN